MSDDKLQRQFDILREVALSSSGGEDAREIIQAALEKTSDLVGLSAGSLIVWDENRNIVLTVSHASNNSERQLLTELEEDLFSDLRNKKHLVSAYFSFGGEEPISAFTLPVKKGKEILGAVIGIQPGSGSLVREDVFLEALSASLSLAVLISRFDSIAEKEKFNGAMAAATTVNHKINNQLQAIVGTTQLLLRNRDDLDDDLVRKLETILTSAQRITDITHKLREIKKVELTEYIDGTQMLKLPDEEENP